MADPFELNETDYIIRLHGDDGDSEASDPTLVLWTKIGFIVIAFLEGAITGMIPTWSSNCRESPKILGVANAFAGGVFLAIAFMHIIPEEIEGWVDYNADKGNDGEVFPLPEALVFMGYLLILLLDKVLFDTHALFEGDENGHSDPAERKL